MQISGVGQAAIQAEEVEFINADSSTTVKAGFSENVIVYPPTGYLYDLLRLDLYVARPPGSTSGDHTFWVLSDTQTIDVIDGKSGFASIIWYEFGYWREANITQRPTTEVGQILAGRDIRFDAANGLRIHYHNDTDADQTTTRRIRLWVRKIKVAT